MFGYLTAFQPELRVRELDTYKAIYCGLCHCLRSHYGLASSAGLSYDFVFLAALGLALEKEEPELSHRRCLTHPFRQRASIAGKRTTLFAAAMQVLLACYKLEDDLEDESGGKKVRARAGLAALRGARAVAEQEYPELSQRMGEQLSLLAQAQSRKGESLDSYTHHSGMLLAVIAEEIGEDDIQRRVLHEIGYQLGRWIYLIDAADDWEQDVSLGRFNALYEAGLATGERLDTKRGFQLLSDTSATVYASLQLLPLRRYKGILENVAGPGMAAKQRAVLFGRNRPEPAPAQDGEPLLQRTLQDAGGPEEEKGSV